MVVLAHDKHGYEAIKHFLASRRGAYQFGVPTEEQAKEDLTPWLTGVSVEVEPPVNRFDYGHRGEVVEFHSTTRLTLELKGCPYRGGFEPYKDVTLCGHRVLMKVVHENYNISLDGLPILRMEVVLEPRGTCPSCGVHKHAVHELAECSIKTARLP